MNEHSCATYRILLVVMLTWIVAYFSSYDFAVFSRIILQFTAGGVSFWKGTFFLVWTILCLALLSQPWRPKQAISKSKFWIIIISPLLLNFLTHYWFTIHYQLGLGERVFAFFQGSVSTNALAHTHILKGALAFVVKLLGISPVSFIGDAGFPFLEMVPYPVTISALILWLLAAITLIKSLLYLERNVAPEKKIAWVLVFIFSSFSVTKSILDGGLLSVECIVGLAAIYLLLRSKNLPARARHPYFLLAGIILLLLARYYDQFSEPLWWYLRDLTMVSSFFLGVYLLFQRKNHLLNSLIGILIICIAVYAARYHYLTWDKQYLATPIPEGRDVFLTTVWNLDLPYELIKEEYGVRIYKFKVSEPTKVVDILRKYRLPPGHLSLRIPGVNCTEKARVLKTGMIISDSTFQLSNPVKSSLLDNIEFRACLPNEPCRYHYRYLVEQCLEAPVPIFFGKIISGLGFGPFIVTEQS